MKIVKQKTFTASESFRLFAVLTLTLVLAFGLVGCAKDVDEIAEDKGGVTAQQIIENPEAYIGKTVTVSGDVEEIHGPKAFNMDSGITIGELLVVGREPFPNLADANDRAYVINDVATVTGVVRKFVTADIEREIGWDLDPEIESEFDGKTVLVANSVGFKPGTASMTTNDADTDQEVAGNNNNTDMDSAADTTNNAAGDVIKDMAVITKAEDPLILAERKFDFSQVKVNRVVGPKTFTIGSGNDELYVMLDDTAARAVGTQGKIDKGDTVNLSGTLRKMTAEQVKDTANDRFRELDEQAREFMKQKKFYLDVNKISEVE